MNLRIFNKLLKEPGLKQEMSEWRIFIELCSMYLKRHKITNPIVVELGLGRGKQKEYWEQLFAAEYIGIDVSRRLSMPDILGDTQKPETLKKLKRKLNGRLINILFIDGDHHYEAIKSDFEMYAPLCSDIIAIHDTECFRYKKRRTARVWQYWDELKARKCEAAHEHKDSLFLSIYKRRPRGCQRGIGVIIKK